MESRETSQNSQPVANFDAPANPVVEDRAGALVTTEAPDDTEKSIGEEIKPRRGLQRRHLPMIIAGTVLGTMAIASSIYGYRWWRYSQQYKVTDNAYIAADMYQVEPQVAGIVTEVSVTPNQEVKPGKALIKLDPRESQVGVNQAKAALDAAKQQVELARQNLSAIASATNAAIPPEPTPAGAGANKPTRTPAGNAILASFNQQRDLTQQQLQAAQASVLQRQAELKQAELKLANATILAMSEGRISNVNVQVGQRVQPGQSLMTVVKPNPWIIANFQENQFEKIQPGQRATIKINAFPSRTFTGTVEGMTSTGVTQTATTPDGQSTRRIPFRINLDPGTLQGYESRITPQMSATVTVNTKPSK